MTATVTNFSLKTTLESGQIFRWEKVGGWYYITIGATIIKVKQVKHKLIYSCNNNNFDVLAYFDLKNKNYNYIMKKISKDKVLAAAIKKYSGLRIIKQDPWECTASFICSSYSNIKRIKQNLNELAKAYGKKIEFDGYSNYSFPTSEAIKRNPIKLRKCRLGYRETYLAATAKKISNGFKFEDLCNSSYGEAKQKIMELDGVGPKVADCILLFSLGFTEAFPVDVWIEKIMKLAYLNNPNLTTSKISEYGRHKFGRNAGYAQQFLYHYARNTSKSE